MRFRRRRRFVGRCVAAPIAPVFEQLVSTCRHEMSKTFAIREASSRIALQVDLGKI